MAFIKTQVERQGVWSGTEQCHEKLLRRPSLQTAHETRPKARPHREPAHTHKSPRRLNAHERREELSQSLSPRRVNALGASASQPSFLLSIAFTQQESQTGGRWCEEMLYFSFTGTREMNDRSLHQPRQPVEGHTHAARPVTPRNSREKEFSEVSEVTAFHFPHCSLCVRKVKTTK